MIDLAGKRVAIYGRYSSALQNERSIEDQVRRCADFVRAAGAEPNDDLVFTDMAISAASLQRPAFERLMEAVHQRRLDAIVTEDVSRVSRDLADSTALFKLLQYMRIPLIGVADGINTSDRSAKLTYTVKSLIADIYLDDLRDKTLRGLEGRFRAGHSTGGVALGYRTASESDERGREIGRRIVVVEEEAALVRRIFKLYVEGRSYARVAQILNEEHVPTPRARIGREDRGWVMTTIRSIIHNRAYIGRWRYKEREWRKAPGTNKRRPRKRDPSEVLEKEHPELRIVEPDLWAAAQARAAAVSARYKGKTDKTSASGARTRYPLSGLLHCALCGAPMVTTWGTSALYYRCSSYKARRNCKNVRGLREDDARAGILGALREKLLAPDAITMLRKEIAARLGEAVRDMHGALRERAERLQRTEKRIRSLAVAVADGDHSEALRQLLHDLEAQARDERAVLERLRQEASQPARLPSPEEVMERALNLEAIVMGDPMRAREVLRCLFDGGRIMVTPQPDGTYVGSCSFLPLVALTMEQRDPPGVNGGSRARTSGCAGRI